MVKKRIKKHSKRNNSLLYRHLKTLKGSSTLILLILVVIVGSILLVGGIFPSDKGRLPRPGASEVVIDTSQPPQTGLNKNSLQLQTLKFKQCANTITVDLMLDRSNSMSRNTPSGVTKIQRLKEAVNQLVSKLTDTSIIGIQSFSGNDSPSDITNDVPISLYSDVKGQVPGAISNLRPSGNTPTHDALAFSYARLQEALPKFPGRKFNFIFVSDGQPVTGGGHSGTQDPRDYTPNPAEQIKALGVNVYTVGIYDQGQADKTQISGLLKDIASKPENYYEATTADDTSKLLTAIAEKICQ